MTKAVFLFQKPDEHRIAELTDIGVTAVFLSHSNLTVDLIKQFKKNNLQVYSEIGIFSKIEDSPNDPDLGRDRLEEIQKIINNLDIDGIWLDFIRYPGTWEVPQPDLSRSNQEVDCQHITNFVAKARHIIDQSNRHIELGLFSVPWTENDFGGAIRRVIGQDFKELAKYVDVFSPMTYHTMCGKPSTWIHKIVTYMAATTGKRILPLIQTENKPKPVAPLDFNQSYEEAIKSPSGGVIVFFYDNLLTQPEKLAIIREKFKND